MDLTETVWRIDSPEYAGNFYIRSQRDTFKGLMQERGTENGKAIVIDRRITIAVDTCTIDKLDLEEDPENDGKEQSKMRDGGGSGREPLWLPWRR